MGEIMEKNQKLTPEERRENLKQEFMQKWMVSGREDERREKTFEEIFKTLSVEEAQKYIRAEEELNAEIEKEEGLEK